jgi:hypothetical protein
MHIARVEKKRMKMVVVSDNLLCHKLHELWKHEMAKPTFQNFWQFRCASEVLCITDPFQKPDILRTLNKHLPGREARGPESPSPSLSGMLWMSFPIIGRRSRAHKARHANTGMEWYPSASDRGLVRARRRSRAKAYSSAGTGLVAWRFSHHP